MKNFQPWAKAPRLPCLFALTLALAMQGCANLPQPRQSARELEKACDADVTPGDKTRLAGIEQMVEEGKVYAALAQLEALRSQAPAIRLMQAEALRKTETPDLAKPLYTSLLDTCHAGRAHHGLGLLLARQGDQAASLMHMSAARQALPTDPRVRNDLGYAQLLAGRAQEARFEFLTALDLQPGEPRVMRNLILLMLQQGEADKAQAMADQLGLDKTTMDRLTQQASELRAVTLPAPPSTPASSTAP